ncbi:hypothetical protein B0H14DRAFT_2655409 [Mycena olivaceomarginata]|nr:hypothetical protein B0H14DRAFT_2655409 [Mycena olivaceomarginata]
MSNSGVPVWPSATLPPPAADPSPPTIVFTSSPEERVGVRWDLSVNLDRFASGLETLTSTVEIYDPYMTHADVAPPAGMADFLRLFVSEWHDSQTQSEVYGDKPEASARIPAFHPPLAHLRPLKYILVTWGTFHKSPRPVHPTEPAHITCDLFARIPSLFQPLVASARVHLYPRPVLPIGYPSGYQSYWLANDQRKTLNKENADRFWRAYRGPHIGTF